MKLWGWWDILVVGRSGDGKLSWWWDIQVGGCFYGGGRSGGGTLTWWWEALVVRCFHGGHHVAQQLCPDDIRQLAWG